MFSDADMKLCFLKREWGPNQQPVISKLLTLTNPNIMHCFIDTFSDHKCAKVPTIIRLDVAKKIMKYLFPVLLSKMLSKNLQEDGQSSRHYGKLLNVSCPIQSLFYVDQLCYMC